jgi:hypothetical protein
MDIMSLALQVVPFVLGIGVVGFYVSRVMSLLKEVAELVSDITEAFEDKQVTKEEIERIFNSYKAVVDAVKAFKDKKA